MSYSKDKNSELDYLLPRLHKQILSGWVRKESPITGKINVRVCGRSEIRIGSAI